MLGEGGDEQEQSLSEDHDAPGEEPDPQRGAIAHREHQRRGHRQRTPSSIGYRPILISPDRCAVSTSPVSADTPVRRPAAFCATGPAPPASTPRADAGVLIRQHDVGVAPVVIGGEFHRPEPPSARDVRNCASTRAPLASEEIADLGYDWSRKEGSAGQMQRCEQVDALAVTRIVIDGGRHQRPRVADDHRLAAKAFG